MSRYIRVAVFWASATFLSASLCGCIAAADVPPSAAGADAVLPAEHESLWRPRVQSVAVFKNGLGFFTRRASVKLDQGWCYASEIPPAAFGTLAVYDHTEKQSVDLVGAGTDSLIEFDGHDSPDDLDTKRKRLSELKGMRVSLEYVAENSRRTASGKVASISDTYAVLEDAAQASAVPLDAIRKLQILDLPLRVHVRRDDDAEASEADLAMAYLRKGIMWIPEYTLNILDDQHAELTLRGTLVNEAEDLVRCDVNFVVGVPHFVHSDLMSPIAVGRVIRSIGSALPYGSVPQPVMSQMMSRAAVANNAVRADQFAGPAGGEGRGLDEIIGSLPQLESAGAGDFTVYTKRDLTVRRGERAIVTLFTQKVRYRDLYRLTPEGLRHHLRLANGTATAWTTGPCLTLSQGHPLSEDVLKYTPRGGTGEVQVTTAINIAHSHSEQEADRKLKAHSPNAHHYFDLVTIAGKIRLRNFDKTPAELLVEHPIEGRPLETDHDGEIRIDATQLRLVERRGAVHWKLTLQPRQEVTLNYRYERYVPSN